MSRRHLPVHPEKVEAFREYLRECLDRRNLKLHTINKIAQNTLPDVSNSRYTYMLYNKRYTIPGPCMLDELSFFGEFSEVERKHLHLLAALAIGYDL